MNTEYIDRLLESFVEKGVPGCSLGISYKGKVIYRGWAGNANIEDGKKVDKDTVFQIYSNTKSITTVALLRLYEQGAFLLNDRVDKYLPFFKDLKVRTTDGSGEINICPARNPLRIKNLLTMTAGIPYNGTGTMAEKDLDFDRFGMSTMEVAKRIAEVPLDFEPGTHYHYGLTFEIVAALCEELSGKPFNEFIDEMVLEPLGMKDTTFILTDDVREKLAITYEWTGNGLEKTPSKSAVPKITCDGPKCYSGGEGILSTVDDLLTFATMLSMYGKHNGNRIISKSTIDLMRRNHLEGQVMEDFKAITAKSWPWFEGYGWGLGCRTHIDPVQSGSNSSIGEFGWCGAAGTAIYCDPEKELAVAYAHQLFPCSVNLQDYCHPRVRNVAYAMIDDLS